MNAKNILSIIFKVLFHKTKSRPAHFSPGGKIFRLIFRIFDTPERAGAGLSQNGFLAYLLHDQKTVDHSGSAAPPRRRPRE
jgi:hypothetical protein